MAGHADNLPRVRARAEGRRNHECELHARIMHANHVAHI
jgi:hypothetical protein